MSNGIIYVIIFCIGLYIGLKLEYKNKKNIKDELDEELYNYYKEPETSDTQKINNIYPNGITPEIIDEWMNGGNE